MELTETRPAAETEALDALTRPAGLSGLLGTGDHKALGRILVTFSILVVAASQVLGFLLRLDTIDGKRHQLFGAARYYSLGTLQPTAVVLVGLIPLMLGIALIVVPLQIGTRALAFPRAAALGVWSYFVAGALLIVSYFTGGGAPLDTGIAGIKVVTRSASVDLWALSLVLLAASIVVLSVVLVTTVFTQRAPGMKMRRIPLFSWSIVVAGILWSLTLPVVAALMLLVWVDHSHGAIFSGTSGAFSQIAWVFGQPQIYALAIPVLGIAGDVVTTFTRTRDGFRRSLLMFWVGLFGILSFGVYDMTAYAVFGENALPQMRFDNPVTIFASILIVIPVFGMLLHVGDAFLRSSDSGGVVKGAPLPGAIISILLLMAAVLLGVFTPIQSLGLRGTLYDDAVVQLVIGSAIAAASAALFHWAAKIVGAQAFKPMGIVAAVLALAGSGAIAVADVLSAITGSAIRHQRGTEGLNTLAVIGWVAIAGTVFLTIVALVVALKRYGDPDVETEADPWGVGQSLEWATASPPRYENFVEIPPVSSEAPLLDELTVEEEVDQ